MQSVLITNEGAKYLIDKILYYPKGVRTLDCMINDAMSQALINQDPGTDGISNDFCNWYVWNAEMFPDETALKFPQFIEKDKGLIFQEDSSRIKNN
jgi:hypothetical protein